jgi:hypothetical protein
MEDNLVICPKCGSDACYQTPINEFHSNYACFGCGYQTSDLIREGEFNFEEYDQSLPYLYVDIKHTDSEGRVWYPQSVNIENQGTVFAYGKNKEEWKWAGVLMTEVADDEKEKFKKPGTEEYYTHKTDMKSLKLFERGNFMDALEYIGVFNDQN